ncbi:MAG TPA: hypothetical protein VK395_23640 [Gemmataceae bacterium]|nr:hypothetical protein [Gemmataceae bacterium]
MSEGIRTPDIQSHSLEVTSRKARASNQVKENGPKPLAQTLARDSQDDSDLAWLMDAWPSLPANVRAAILALAEAMAPNNSTVKFG